MDRSSKRGVSPRAGSLTTSLNLSETWSPRSGSPVPSPRRDSASATLGNGKGPGGKGIQMTIQHLADEQERVQKKTFTNWINSYLCKRAPPIKVTSLFDDIKDGKVLLALLETLSGDKLPGEKGAKLKRVHYVSNISTALRFLEDKKIKLVNINASDIADGKPSIVLGLIWTIILYFQIEETATRIAEQQAAAAAEGGAAKKMTPLERFRVSAKKALMQWTESAISKRYGLKIKDFGSSWKDGVAFNAIIHNIRPELVDMEKIHQQTPRANLENAFSTAESHLGIARLIDPEDVDVEKPDEKSIMTYVAQFMKAFPDAGEDPATRKSSRPILTTAEQEQKDLDDLLTWIREAEDILKIVKEPVQDLQQEYIDYASFKTNYDLKEEMYNTLGQKINSKRAIKLTEANWKTLKAKFLPVSENTTRWLQKLDSQLPGKMGDLGTWLIEAEQVLGQDPQMIDSPEEMALQLSQILQHHREYFKDADALKQLIQGVKRAGKYEGQSIYPPHLDDLHKRFMSAYSRATVREKRLEYELHKNQMSAFLLTAEEKLNSWQYKCGRQEDVEAVIADYKDFVQAKKLTPTFEKMNTELKKKAEAYKKESPKNKETAEEVDKHLMGVSSKWKSLSADMKNVEQLLVRVVDQWRRFNTSVELLTVWIAEGQATLTKSPEDKQAYLKDLAPQEEKHKVMNELGTFLMDITEESVASDIKDTVSMTNQDFDDLVANLRQAHLEEVIEKGRGQYTEGVQRLKAWIESTEDLLAQEVPSRHAQLKEYLQLLDNINAEIPQVEANFKATTKTAQSLVLDSSPEVVNKMLDTLNAQKEVIVKLRKELPDRMKNLKAILPNVESLENGITDLSEWLAEGEKLLDSHKLDGDAPSAEARLEKHKTFFAETTYQKSILESKAKVYQKVMTAKSKLKNVDFSVLEDGMESLQTRFQTCINSSKAWEQKLDTLTRMWRTVQQKARPLDDWLEQADSILKDRDDDPESLLRKHKLFFGRSESKLMEDYVTAAEYVKRVLVEDGADTSHLQHTTDNYQQNYQIINYHAPIQAIKLEFGLQEEKFLQQVESGEKIVLDEQQQLHSQQNVKDVLKKHRQQFHESSFIPTCQECLSQMQENVDRLREANPDDSNLEERYDNHLKRWRALLAALDETHLRLKQLPERWSEYNNKLGDFSKFVSEVERLAQALQDESLTIEEYKQAQTDFQAAMRNLSKIGDEYKWLEENLDELLQDAPDTDSARERARLEAIMARFRDLQPDIQQSADKSSLFAKCYEFRDGVGRRTSWLDDYQKQVMDQPYVDGLEDAKAYLHEHEDILRKLESEKAQIQSDIETGERLRKDKDAPSFVNQTIEDLARKWKDTNTLAKAKHEKLKQSLNNWEQYELEKNNLVQYLKRAETELEKPPVASGQEHAQKDLQSKKEIQSTLSRLKGKLTDMQNLNAMLAEGASRERRGPLKGEMSDIDKKLQNISVRLNAKLADLEATLAKWSEYYKRLNHFCDWLNEKEGKLTDANEEEESTPEDQYDKTKDICSEIYDNHITLENLEKDGRGMSQNFRSRETAALKSKLTAVRRQWESLCNRAKDRSSTLYNSVAHWHLYQNLAQQLMPWIVKAEQYCSTELPKCSSVQEARELHDLHQKFLQECEEQFPLFEKMNTEAGYLMEQPVVAEEVGSIRQRWSDIVSTTEERTRRVDKMHGAWNAYDNEQGNFEEVLERLDGRLEAEPNVSSVDVQVLQNEVALCKTLQEEVRSHQPKYNALQRQFEQLRPYVKPESIENLEFKQDAVKARWENVNSGVVERQAVLRGALQHRRDFYAHLQDFEKWVKKMQRKLDTGSEIYTDEVNDTQNKLKTMNKECSDNEPMFDSLQQEFKELMQGCNEDEATILSDRFDKLLAGYTKMEDQVKNRDELCQKWDKYHDAHKDTQTKLKQLHTRLANPNLTEGEITQIKEDLDVLKAGMNIWTLKSGELDELMRTAQLTIKDRSSQRTLHFGSELQAIDTMCDQVAYTSQHKQEQLDEVSQMWKDFTERNNDLIDRVKEVEDKVDNVKAGSSDLKGLKEMVRDIEDIRDDVTAQNPEYEQLRELGRQIMRADSSKAPTVQAMLKVIGDNWQSTQAVIASRHQQYSDAVNAWEQYHDCKQGVTRVLQDINPTLSQDSGYDSQGGVKKALDQHKTAEFDLQTNQSQLDHMNTRGLQLLEQLKSISDFDIGVMEEDLDEINHQWETADSMVESRRDNLELQLACWDQVQSGSEELGSWVNTMVAKLEESLTSFDDAVSVETRLQKFKEELPYFAEVMGEMKDKIHDLKQLNRDSEIPALLEEQAEIQDQFDRATSLANQLERVLTSFSDERLDLQKSIDNEALWLNEIKDQLVKQDDVSGSDEDIISRLHRVKDVRDELEAHKKEIELLEEKAILLQEKYPSTETANLTKDAMVLHKKFSSILVRSDKVEEMLEVTLEQHCTEAQQDQQRWLQATKEKVVWCADIGDRYGAEAKLATITELEASVEVGEQKRQLAEAKANLLKSVLPQSRQGELEQKNQTAIQEWKTLVENMGKTKTKLESSIDQWRDYDSKYESLSQWLKEAEAKLRMESALKPDLHTKREQLELFKELEADILRHCPDVEDIRDSAGNISHSTGDNRTATYAAQLVTRYQTLANSLKEQAEKYEENMEEHERYQTKYRDCIAWVHDARAQLETCSQLAGDQDALEVKLDVIKALHANKDLGLTKFNAALEFGEKLYPNTANEGREAIRQELRSLRELWENFSDNLNDTQRKLDSNCMQWSSFDESYDQLQKWLDETEVQLDSDKDLKNTLQEKKVTLQCNRTRCQDIQSHQSMMDNLGDKGRALSSSNIANKVNQISAQYNALSANAQEALKHCGEYVDQHQLYQDSLQTSTDWLTGLRDRLVLCSELTGDKHTIQNRLDRAQNLLANMKEGETKLKTANIHGEKTVPQTAAMGQSAIHQELDSLTSDWDMLTARMGETQQNLVHAMQALETYDSSCDNLSKWLKQIETKVKDVELKSTLKDKKIQVEKLKDLEEQLAYKEDQFDDLLTSAQQIQSSDPRLANTSNQLKTRYQTLKANIKDVIKKWEEAAVDQETYNANYATCTQWIDMLHKRVEVCSHLAGDKHDVEDRLAKLQELSAERDQGVSVLHQAVESGERLYSTTASEGRDAIRQDLRTLREQWELVGDDMSETQRKLESCLTQWSSYDTNFDQMQKWLLEAEIQLNEDSDLKATLPEKKAQLQAHKVLHQDILSHQHAVDILTEKAHALTHATPTSKVGKYAGELQQKYERLCASSKHALDRYEGTVRDHQQLQDSYQDSLDWLNVSREKVLVCSDTSGDRLSIQNKLERLKEYVSNNPAGEAKLMSVVELATKTLANTSPAGQEVIKREATRLQSEWQGYTASIEQTERDLGQTQQQWGGFNIKFDDLSAWLKDQELQVKDHELKATLGEKQAQVDKFKDLREQISSRQTEVDRFIDEAQTLMHTSSDIRLGTHVSQLSNRYQGLLALLKDLIIRWDKYVEEHKSYEDHHIRFSRWLSEVQHKLDGCTQPAADRETMEERKVLLQMLLGEKEHGLQKLTTMIESGEKLFPDTAVAGREKIRQELRNAKDDWEHLYSNLSDSQRKVDTFLQQWASFSDGQDKLSKWMTDIEATLQPEFELKNTLQEKKSQLQHHKTVHQDILSHQRQVDSVVEKAQGVLQSASNSDVAGSITDVSSRYEKMTSTAKTMIQKSDQYVQEHQQYQDALQTGQDWLTTMKDRLSICSDPAGDKHTIQNKLDRLQDLITTLADGAVKIEACEKSADITLQSTAALGRQTIQQSVDNLRADWEDMTSKIDALKTTLDQSLNHWSKYNDQNDRLVQWLKDMERQVKDFPQMTTLEQKQDQHKKYQAMIQDIRGHQGAVDEVTDEAQMLQQLTGDVRVSSQVSQLGSRYQTLLSTVKDINKKCEQNVTDHQYYQERLADSTQWLEGAKLRFTHTADVGGSKTELENKLDKIQELRREREAGFSKLNQTVEAGEKLYPNTAPDGRDMVRQELRALKLDWESLFDDLSSDQCKLEVALVQWTSFDDGYEQVEGWLKDTETELDGPIPLKSTLEEKKTQAQHYKAGLQDVISYQRVIDSVTDKAQTLVQTSNVPHLTQFVTQTAMRYQKLCLAAKEYAQQYDVFVSEHQQYSDAYNDAVEWLNTICEKLSMCSDISGDRHAVQGRLDKIQDIIATKIEGEPKVKNVLAMAEKVLLNTALQGKELIVRETEALRSDWDAFITALAKTKDDLEKCMSEWHEFDGCYDGCNGWLKDLELKLKEVELKPTFQEKQFQLNKIQKLLEVVSSHQSDIDELGDVAQNLAQTCSDSRVVSQASQLTTRYQTLTVNAKEVERRWKQYVKDHVVYQTSRADCSAWIDDMKKRLAVMNHTSGNRQDIEERKSLVQVFMTEKEDGLHNLQVTLDNMQIILPNTSVAGRDVVRREMQALHQDYDGLSAELTGVRGRLEACLAQWTIYSDGSGQAQRWLRDLDTQLANEAVLQPTLEEKKLQHDRIKVLQLNIASQKSTIENLSEKASNLKETTNDGSLLAQTEQISGQYDHMVSNIQDLQKTCTEHVEHHQVYRDSFLEASDWLAESMEKLSTCSDMRGDRHTTEAHLGKVKDLAGTTEDGRVKLDKAVSCGDQVEPETSPQGQKLIEEELGMLNHDFSMFETEVSDLETNLENILDQWQEYDECYQELSQWIQDTDSSMKDQSSLQLSLQDKTAQLEQQKSTHEQILEQQKTFDRLTEHAQILLQSTTDSRVTSQLGQLSSRYTVLMAASKELLKRYEQHVHDHSHFREAYTEAEGWLEATHDRLSVCANSAGDKYLIQTQLEKLQEFVVLKDEGQLLIHTASTWSEKTIMNTSSSGQEMIREDMEKLQRDWDTMMANLTDTKVSLESRLIRWTDYDDSLSQMQKWMKDMEKKARDNEPRADLSEKKANHQRIKGLHHDILSYEHMVQSVCSKAKDLSSADTKVNNDLGQLSQRYDNLRDTAQDLLDRGEHSVAQHQEYQDGSNDYISWLRGAREKLATCSDTFGEKSAILGKIEKVKALSQNLREGSQKLMDVTAAGEGAIPNTSPQGQSKIRQELQTMNNDFDEYGEDVAKAQADLETCLAKWNDFEDSYKQFNCWLKDTEDYLRADLEAKETLQEKKDYLDTYQHYCDEVKVKQVALDTVNEKAQALLKTNADARTSHAITQLTTKYQAILSLCKDNVKKLGSYHADHQTYEANLGDFSDWLEEAKIKLRQTNDTSGSKDDVNTRLDQVKEIQAILDHGNTKLRRLMDSSDKTIQNTNPRGCQVIRQETDEMRDEYEKLKSQTSLAKRGLEDTLSQWGDFDRAYRQLSDWMSDTESKIKSDPDLKSDLPEKRSSLEKFKAIQNDITAHRDLMDKLEYRASQMTDPNAKAAITELKTRYEALLSSGKDGVEAMEGQVQSHEEYRKAYNNSVDWLSDAKRKLQRLNDSSGDCRTLETRQQALQDFQAEIGRGEDVINQTNQIGEELCEWTAPRGQHLVRQELQTLKDDWHTFSVAVGEVEANLETAITDWRQYEGEQAELNTWLENRDAQVKVMMSPQPDLVHKQHQLKEGQKLYEEIQQQKSVLDQVRADAESVSSRSSDPRVSTNIMQLSNKYQTLQAAAKTMIGKLEENAGDHRAYNDAYDECLQWLDMTHQRLHDCNDTSGDWHTLADKIDLVKEITASMDDGLQRVNRCCDLAEKILPNTALSGKKTIDQEITKLTQDWEEMNREINESSSMLEGVQSKWHEYEEIYGTLVRWMADTEGALTTYPEPKAQLVEKKTQLDKYRMILSDVENHERLVNELNESVANLEALSDNPEVADSLHDVRNRYDTLKNTANDIVDVLERSYDEHLEYHEAQQDCEKWLLQTSFKLMSHNALNVSTMELTQRQIDKHRSLLREIEEYQGSLEQVTDKGRSLVENNPRVPQLSQQVQAQVQNLEESYRNLQATAVQIKNRLDDILKKWQEYKSLLEKTDQYLADDFPDWLENANENIPDDLQDAYRQLEATKTMYEKLNSMKQELSNAAHRCESLSGTETTDQSAEESAIASLAEQVNESMDESIGQVDTRMNQLRDIIHQWESVERQRTELRNWLHYKQEEVQELEQKPAKLHAEAAELEISRIKALRDDVQAKGPTVEGFVDRYRTLTQHNPSLADPVVRAVQDDWEELLGQVDNLIIVKERALQHSRDYPQHKAEMDDDLDRLAHELERIDTMEATVTGKGLMAAPPHRRVKKSRGTQTPFSSSQRLNKSYATGSDHDSDSDGEGGFGPRHLGRDSRGGARDGMGLNLHDLSRSSNDMRSPSPLHAGRRGPPSHLSPPSHPGHPSHSRPPSHLSPPGLKKGANASAELESDTDESGYGDTCTQHTRSFDTALDYSQEDLLSAMSATPRGATAASYGGYESDGGTTISYMSDLEYPYDPESLRDVACQTPGYARTQTPASFMNGISAEDLRTSLRTLNTLSGQILQDGRREIEIQTNMDISTDHDNVSSSGTQTRKKKKKKGTRSELLKSILSEVKTIKAEKGLDTSASEIESDTASEVSGTKPRPLSDFIRGKSGRTSQLLDRSGETVTISEDKPPTPSSRSLFSPSNQQGPLQDQSGQTTASPHTLDRSNAGSRTASPLRPLSATPQSMAAFPAPEVIPAPQCQHYSPQVPAATHPPPVMGVRGPPIMMVPMMNSTYPLPTSHHRRRVGIEDLQAVQNRLEKLRNYQVPGQPSGSLSTFQPEERQATSPTGIMVSQVGTPMWTPLVPAYVVQPPPATIKKRKPKPRYHVRDFSRSYDDIDTIMSDSDSGGRSRRRDRRMSRVIDHYHLDDALFEAAKASRQLKKLSQRMKNSLRDEILKG